MRQDSPLPDRSGGRNESGIRTAIESELNRALPARPVGLGEKVRLGDTLGMYLVEEVVAIGGMATIYKGKHTGDGHLVALKVLHPELTGHPDLRRRFLRETRAIRRARHPNIVEVYDVIGAKDVPPVLVMELLEGIDLFEYIGQHAPIPPERAVEIAVQICGALSILHRLRIVHRDLKPENIFVIRPESEQPGIKLLDLGLAKKLAATTTDLNIQLSSSSVRARVKTPVGAVLGTPHYMSPEQIRGVDVSYPADIYALGVVLYEMLTGRLPFDSSQHEDVLRMHIANTPEPPSAQLPEGTEPEIPYVLDEIVLRCLAKQARARYRSAKDLKSALESSLRDPEGNAAPSRPRLPPATGRVGLLWALVGMVLCLGLTIVVWLIVG